MSTDTARVMPMPGATHRAGGRRRGAGRTGQEGERTEPWGPNSSGAGGESDGQPLVLKERFSNEGGAMVEALKRDVPYYRVEVWRSRAIVKEGSVEIKKEAVSARN